MSTGLTTGTQGEPTDMNTTATRYATAAQVSFARKLWNQTVDMLPADDSAKAAMRIAIEQDLSDDLGEATTTEGSAVIERLLEMVRKVKVSVAAAPAPVQAPAPASTPASTPAVPEGRYAVTTDGVTRFYHVDAPTTGKWAGYTFVKIQASDDLFPVKGAGKAAVLAAIAIDPAAASLLYGTELGVCGVCGRTLTDEASRARGIGPVCAEKTGW